MNPNSSKVRDRRQSFASRFDAIARLHGVAPNGLLSLHGAESSGQNEQTSTEQSAALSSGADVGDSTSIDMNAVGQNPCLIVPGLLGDSVRNLVAPLMCARERLDSLGYDISIAWVNGRAGCDRNAALLLEKIVMAADSHGSPVDIIAYSKGCADCLHMLGNYPDTHIAVRSLVSLAGVVHGTPLAQDPPWLLRKLLQYTPVPSVPVGDGRAIVDLSPDIRKRWLADHPLPANIYYASIAAAPSRDRVSRILKRSYDKLAMLDSANDSQVIDDDTMLPGSDLLALVNADHWAVALPVKQKLPLIARLLVNQNDFPRDVLLRAIIDHLNDVASTAI